MIDAFVIGEAEPSIPALTRVLIRERSRQERLAALAELPGIYVPTLPASKPVERLVWDGLAESPRTSLVISPHTAFPDRFLIETGRGCPMGCRFCLARSIYRPVRQARPESLMKAALEGLRVTNRIGLIGAALSGYPDLDELVGDLVDRGAEVSLSSLRADRLSPGLVRALRRGGQDSLTIAPEAGTEALRAAVGKPITDAQLEQAIASAEGEGIRDLKLYFMTNLPGETAEDRRAIVDLAASYAARRAGVRFAVTVSPFVPKPWTPFEGEAFPALREARAALESVTNGLRRLSRVSVRPASARFSAVQAALARGDREVGRAIVAATDKGGSYAALKKALKAEGVDLDQPLLAPEGRPWQRALGRGHVRRSIGGVGREGEA